MKPDSARGSASPFHTRLACLGCAFLLGAAPEGSFSAAVEATLLDRAFAQLQAYDWGQPADALLALDDAIAASHRDPSSRHHLEQRLLTVIQTNATAAAKQLACRRLALVGTRDSVPALAALLTQAQLSHMARFVLERIPDPAAATALRDALAKTRGPLKLGVISSLGALADQAAALPLAALLQDNDPAVAAAAVIALGHIGTLEAARALESFRPVAPEPLQSLANDALVAATDNLARRGQRAEAARIFRRLYTDQLGMLRLAGFTGLVQTEPDHSHQLLLQALTEGEEPLRRLAVRILTDLPDRQTLQSLLESWKSLPATGQLALLEAVRVRRDSLARPTVLMALESSDPAVRLAALGTLGLIGTSSEVAMLTRLLANGGDAERAAARQALATLPGRQPTEAILAMLPTSPPSLQLELIHALLARGASQSSPQLAPYLEDANASIRAAALEAIAALGTEQQLPVVIAFLKSGADDAARGQAGKALTALIARSGTNCLETLLAAAADAQPPARVILLEQLGSLGGKRALDAVRADLSRPEAEVREAAFRVLAGWPDWDAAPDLWQIVQDPRSPAWHAVAFRGYLRLCRDGQLSQGERWTRLSEAARHTADASEKLLVASALADLPEPGALELLTAYLDDPALVDPASLAIVKVAGALGARHKDAAVAALRRVLQLSRNADVQKQARQALDKLGASTP